MKKFVAQIKNDIVESIKNPKRLIPTFVLMAVWLILPILTNFIPKLNTPFIRFINTLTYAKGGINNGIIGLIGGVFGKALFAAIVNGIVLSICAKKNPFAGVKGKIIPIIKDAKKAINPLLIGSGIGLLMYWIFNTSISTQNIAIAVVALVASMQALAKQNGLTFALAFGIAKKVSKGKSPSRLMVSRVLTGLTAGFALALPMTFTRSPLLIIILGVGLLIVGSLNGKKDKQTVAMLMMCMCLATTFGTLSATEVNMPSEFTAPSMIEGLDFGQTFSEDPHDEGYSNPANLDGIYLVPKSIITYSVDFIFPEEFAGRHIIGIGEEPITFNTENIKVLRKGNNSEYTISGGKSFTGSDKTKGGSYSLEYTYEFTIKNLKMVKHSIIADYEGTEKIKWWSDDSEYPAGEKTIKISGRSDDDECAWNSNSNGYQLNLKTPKADIDDKKGLSMVFEIAGVMPSGKSAGIVAKPPKAEKDKDSDIDVHDVALIGATILTTVIGGIGGAIGAGSASGSAFENLEFGEDEDLGENIEKDEDGDIYVKDASTGKKTLYKSNGDGTYKNMVTGDSYTEAEIKEHADYVARNSEYFKDVNRTKDEAILKQREDAKKISDFGKEVDEKVKAEESTRQIEEAHQEYKEKVSEKYGTNDEKEIKKEILKERNEEYAKQGEALSEGDIAEGLEKSASNVEQASDVILDVLSELDTTGAADVVKDVYSGAKAVGVNAVQVATGEKTISGAITSAATDAAVEISKNHSKSIAEKLLTNSSGDAIKTVADGYAKGLSEEEIKKKAKDAAASGAINAAVDVSFDKASGKVISKMKKADKTVGKVLRQEVSKESITKAGKSAANNITKNIKNSEGK